MRALPEADEGPHDLDVHENGTPTAEHAREHRDPLLDEGMGARAGGRPVQTEPLRSQIVTSKL
jgi:hypothetical protein